MSLSCNQDSLDHADRLAEFKTKKWITVSEARITKQLYLNEVLRRFALYEYEVLEPASDDEDAGKAPSTSQFNNKDGEKRKKGFWWTCPQVL